MIVLCSCDTVPEKSLGRQFGIVSVGLSIGSLIGPPVSGTLYQRWGLRAPFIFGIIVTGVDFLARLLLIERHEAMRWGVDSMIVDISDKGKVSKVAPEIADLERADKHTSSGPQPVVQEGSSGLSVTEARGWNKVEIEEALGGNQAEQLQESKQSRTTSLPHTVLLKLMKSPRAVVCIVAALVWGLVFAAQEATVVLHLNRIWGLDPHQAGIAFIAVIIPAIFCRSRLPIHCNTF